MQRRSQFQQGNPDLVQAVPFEVTGLLGALFGGVTVFFTRQQPNSITSALPEWAGIAWSAGLAFGAAIALLGIFWRWDPDDSLLVEQVGLVAAGAASVVYAVALAVAANNLGTAAPIGLIAGFGAACLWRSTQILRAVRRATS